MNEPIAPSTVEALLAAGAASVGALSALPGQPGSTSPYVVVPNGYDVKTLEHLLPAPQRARGRVKFYHVDSFCRFVTENKAESTRIYQSDADRSMVAVFDDTTTHHPGWGGHRAILTLRPSREWEEWSARNGKAMTQAEYALFMEDFSIDVVEPGSASMLEISRTLQAKKNVNFSSGIRLDNGAQELTFEEAISASAGKGRLAIPERFKIGVRVFDHGERYAVDCRLRYRITDAKLVMWHAMVRPDLVIEDAMQQVAKQVEQGTGLKPYRGEPPEPK